MFTRVMDSGAEDAPAGALRAFVDRAAQQRGEQVSVLAPLEVGGDELAELRASPNVANVTSGDHAPLQSLAPAVVMLGMRHHLSLRWLLEVARAGGRTVCWWSPVGGLQSAGVAKELAARLGVRLADRAIQAAGTTSAGRLAADLVIGGQLRRAVERAMPSTDDDVGAARRGIVMTVGALNAGGAQRQLVITARALVERGEDVSVIAAGSISGSQGFFVPELRGAGITVTSLAMTSLHELADLASARPAVAGAPCDLRLLVQGGWLWGAVGEQVAALALELMRRRPAVVHSWLDQQNVIAGLAGLVAGVPRVVLSGRNVAPDMVALENPSMRPAYRMLLERASVTLTTNSEAGALDYARWLGLPGLDVPVVRNAWRPGAQVDARQVERWRAAHGIPNGPLLGGVLRFSAEKRPHLWLEVACAVLDRMPTAHAAIVGEGPDEQAVRARIQKERHGGRIHLVPPSRDIDVAYAAMHVMLLTSRQEGLPNVIIEAQGAGVPVVATAVGGVPEAMEDGATGILVADGPALGRRLADAVAGLLLDAQRRAAFGAAGRRFVAQAFSVDRMIDESMQVYRGHHGVNLGGRSRRGGRG